MESKYAKSDKKSGQCAVTIETLIERLKKMRALNCDPKDVGMDAYVWKQVSLNNTRAVTKYL
jgi:hypothetical protein